jgi:23S rRNA pseudouridine2605 synthase
MPSKKQVVAAESEPLAMPQTAPQAAEELIVSPLEATVTDQGGEETASQPVLSNAGIEIEPESVVSVAEDHTEEAEAEAESEAELEIESEAETELEPESEAETEAEQEAEEPTFPSAPGAKLERLHKILAQAGVASRRAAEEMIQQGRVQVNGRVVTVLGSKADPARDHIRVDGKLLHGAERLRYFMLNKPKGYITTASDPEGRPTVMEFFSKLNERLYPVGRLDYQSEGLLLVTNDGDLANRLTRAASNVEKTYLVKIAGQPTEEELDRLRRGVVIDRGRPGSPSVLASPTRIRPFRHGDNPWYEVVLTEGRNREIRKIFEEIDHFVEKIRRVGYGPLILDLEPGKTRELLPEEVEQLRLAAEGKLRGPKYSAKNVTRRSEFPIDAQPPAARPRSSQPRTDRPAPDRSGQAKRFSGKPFSGSTNSDRPQWRKDARSDRKPYQRPAAPGSRPFGDSREATTGQGRDDRRPQRFQASGPRREGSRPFGDSRNATPGQGRDDRRPQRFQSSGPRPEGSRPFGDSRNAAPGQGRDDRRPQRFPSSGPRREGSRPFSGSRNAAPGQGRDDRRPQRFPSSGPRREGSRPFSGSRNAAPGQGRDERRPQRFPSSGPRPEGSGRPMGTTGRSEDQPRPAETFFIRPTQGKPYAERPLGAKRTGPARPASDRPFRSESGPRATSNRGSAGAAGSRPYGKTDRPKSYSGSAPRAKEGTGWKPKRSFGNAEKSPSGSSSAPRGRFGPGSRSGSKPASGKPHFKHSSRVGAPRGSKRK